MKHTIPLALVAALLAAPAYGQNAAERFAAQDANRGGAFEWSGRGLSLTPAYAHDLGSRVGNWFTNLGPGDRQWLNELMRMLRDEPRPSGMPSAMNPDGRPSSSEVNARQRERAAQRARQQERSQQIDRRRGNDPHP